MFMYIIEFQIVSQKRYEKILTDLFQLLFLLTQIFIIFDTFRSLPIGTSLLNISNTNTSCTYNLVN